MGNRAVITTEDMHIGIYLHWNGGRDSIEGFLAYCELRKFRLPEEDNYGWARLCTVISNFFGGDLSIGIDTVDNLDCDNGDNGMYVIKGWKIVARKFFSGDEDNNHDLLKLLLDINDAQPVADQLSPDVLNKYVGKLKGE